jgi:hypothetical protein
VSFASRSPHLALTLLVPQQPPRARCSCRGGTTHPPCSVHRRPDELSNADDSPLPSSYPSRLPRLPLWPQPSSGAARRGEARTASWSRPGHTRRRNKQQRQSHTTHTHSPAGRRHHHDDEQMQQTALAELSEALHRQANGVTLQAAYVSTVHEMQQNQLFILLSMLRGEFICSGVGLRLPGRQTSCEAGRHRACGLHHRLAKRCALFERNGDLTSLSA